MLSDVLFINIPTTLSGAQNAAFSTVRDGMGGNVARPEQPAYRPPVAQQHQQQPQQQQQQQQQPPAQGYLQPGVQV
jgi:hypothetical protein